VNVARRRAGQRAAPHLRPAGRRPPSLSLSLGHDARAVCSLGRREAGETKNDLGFRRSANVPQFCSHESPAQPLIGDERLSSFWARFDPGGRRERRPRPSSRFASAKRAGPDRNQSLGHCFKSFSF
jgi:hypothetical protein